MHDVGKIAIPDAILQNPGKFKAQPKQPGYIRTPYTTVTFTNQVAKRSATRKTRQTTKKTWYEPMAASSQAGAEACIFRTVQSKNARGSITLRSWRLMATYSILTEKI